VQIKHALFKADFWLIAFGAIYDFLTGFEWVASNLRIPHVWQNHNNKKLAKNKKSPQNMKPLNYDDMKSHYGVRVCV
jgi:hypothetical protein